MTLVRRLIVLAAFAFWQGGFTFYAAVVVPIGTDVLGSVSEQARITRRVTVAMNLAGLAAIVIFAADVALESNRRRGRAVVLGIITVLLIALVVLRAHLDALFHGPEAYVDDRAAFRPWHRLYLWLSTVQWAASVAFLALTLAAWFPQRGSARPPRAPSVS
jgi:hypothetical protein